MVEDADFDMDPLPFLNTPLTFGARAQDVLDGATPALGVSFFYVQFMNAAPHAPLPDLVQLINDPTPAQVPTHYTLHMLAPGARADGTPALLLVAQTCGAEVDAASGEVLTTCTQEVVDFFSLPNAAEE